MYLQAALITALTTIVITIAMYFVGRARGKYQIKAPAITGHPDFERAFRAHQNTLEQAIMFLPLLWLASIYCNEQYAAYLGYAWLLGRLWYVFGYIAEAGKRSMGFTIGAIAQLGLLGMSLWGIISKMM
ncbi:MAG TPA: MAPEG family protein [Arenimonas sp.]|nr:MAPEG family protein [Arenimonas sp.]HOZ04496.1 MAPEG family protein [Arenimonas sp.]HPO24142.1 MAPEG family protein [Arenimonas sp.]HPW33963.1 MAPEG family protein [Arenimonas sp.]